MNIFLILSLLIISFPLSKQGDTFVTDLKQMSKTVAENSLVKVFVGHGRNRIQGSGTLFSVRNNIKILTNAHVCLGSDYIDVVFNKKKDITISFQVDSKELFASKEVRLDQLVYNLKEDWCLIPLETHNFRVQVLSHHSVHEKMPIRASTMTYNRRTGTSKYDKFTACATDPFFNFFATDEGVCDLDPIPQGSRKINLSTRDNKKKKIELGEHYLYKFPTIPGDSGSPVFDVNNKLVGLVVGQQVNPTDKNKTDWGFVSPISSFKTNLKNKIIFN